MSRMRPELKEAERDLFRRHEPLWLVLIGAVALLPLVGLGGGDLAKDEGMWALRVRAIVEHGAWMDQTPWTINGLYSGCYPPLQFWAMAASMEVFGVSPIAARLPSAIFGAGTVIVIYFIARKTYGFRPAVMASVIFGLGHSTLDLARTAEPDSIYVFFVTLAIYLYMRYQRGSGRQLVILPLAGMAMGMALLSKPFLGLYVPLVLLPYLMLMAGWQRYGVKQLVIDLLVLGLGALAVASSWHLYMLGKYPEPVAGAGAENGFWHYFFERNIVQRASSAFEGHRSTWGPLYYANVLVSYYPFVFALGVAGLIETGRALGHKLLYRPAGLAGEPGAGGRSLLSLDDRMRLLIVIWLVVSFLVPTLFASKVSKYILMAAVPFSILAGTALDRVYRGATSQETNVSLFVWTVAGIVLWQTHKAQAALAALVAMAFSWGEQATGELAVLADGGSAALLRVALAIAGALTLALGIWALRKRVTVSHESIGRLAVPFVVVPMLVIGVWRVGFRERAMPAEEAFAAARMAGEARGLGCVDLADQIVVFGHWEDNFQMAYYTNGANYGVVWDGAAAEGPRAAHRSRLTRIEGETGTWRAIEAGREADALVVDDPLGEVEEIVVREREARRSLLLVILARDPEVVGLGERMSALVERLIASYGAERLTAAGGDFELLFLRAAR